MFLSPLWTYLRFQEAISQELTLIALDNASIRLGRSARDVWNGLRIYNDSVAGTEGVHHIWHACARNPATAPECLAIDQQWEAALLARKTLAHQYAQRAWGEGRIRAEAEGKTHHQEVRVFRLPSVPIHAIACPLCGLSLQWEVDALPIERSEVRKGSRVFLNRIFSVGTSLRRGLKWNYRIEGGGDGK